MTPLEKYIELKLQIDQLTSQLKEVEPQATEQALDQIYNQEGTGKTFAFSGRQVQVRFKNRRPRPQDDPESEYLFEEIQQKREELYKLNQHEIEGHLMMAEQHKSNAEALQIDDEVTKLSKELEEFLDKRSYQQPELVIKAGK